MTISSFSSKKSEKQFVDLSSATFVHFQVFFDGKNSICLKVKNCRNEVKGFYLKNGEKAIIDGNNFVPGKYFFLIKEEGDFKIDVIHDSENQISTPIFQSDLPYTITRPGAYHFAENLSLFTDETVEENVYAIKADNVDNFSINGNGFELSLDGCRSRGIFINEGNNISLLSIKLLGLLINCSPMFLIKINNLTIDKLYLRNTGFSFIEFCNNVSLSHVKTKQEINRYSQIYFYNCMNVDVNTVQTKNSGFFLQGIINGLFKNFQMLTEVYNISPFGCAFSLFSKTSEDDYLNNNIRIKNFEIINNAEQPEVIEFLEQSFLIAGVNQLTIDGLNIVRNISKEKEIKALSLMSFYNFSEVLQNNSNINFKNSSITLNSSEMFSDDNLVFGIDFFNDFNDTNFNKINLNNVKVTGFESNIIFDGNNGSNIVIDNCQTNGGNLGYIINNCKDVLCRNSIANNASFIGFTDNWYVFPAASTNLVFSDNVAFSCGEGYSLSNSNNILENNKSYFSLLENKVKENKVKRKILKLQDKDLLFLSRKSALFVR